MWGAAFLCNDKCTHIVNRMKQSVYSTTKATSQLMRLACPICKFWSTSFRDEYWCILTNEIFPCCFVTRELQSCPVAAYRSYTTNLSVLWIAEDSTGEEQDPKRRVRSCVEHLSALSGEQANQRGWLKATIDVHGWPNCHWKDQVMEVFWSKTDWGKKK